MLLLYPPKDYIIDRDYNIYIPLCFYFIYVFRDKERRESPFTFHYASTLSQKRLRPWQKKLHLHSTMLLLYLYVFSMLKYFLFYLHSTMLLLYLTQCSQVTVCQRYLHSTMLLLYPGCCEYTYANLRHLHSTMLLLYRDGL